MRLVLRTLDGLYRVCSFLACTFLASIALLVVLQVATRLLGILWEGLIDYATYAMVASAFLGLGPALKRGAHIRVTLLIGAVRGERRRALEILCLLVGSGLMAYLAWYCILLTLESWQFGYRSVGLAATPLWIPQAAMTFGAVVATVAFLDELLRTLFAGVPAPAAEAGPDARLVDHG